MSAAHTAKNTHAGVSGGNTAQNSPSKKPAPQQISAKASPTVEAQARMVPESGEESEEVDAHPAEFEEESESQTSSDPVLGKRQARPFDVDSYFAARDTIRRRVEALTPEEAVQLTDQREIMAYNCLLQQRSHADLARRHLHTGTLQPGR